MYLPASFREDQLDAQIALVRANPLGMLISQGEQGLVVDPLPFLIDADEQGNVLLRAHLSRANSHWRLLQAARDGYISPGWYETKRRSGKVVPTWNYSVVQLRGTPRITEDARWLRQQLEGLTALQEGHQPEPWRMEDAPAHYIAAQIQGIVGIEIAVTERLGKWKMSQNRSADDADGVIAGLRAGDSDQQQLADEVERRRG